jgi:hypothetical protein
MDIAVEQDASAAPSPAQPEPQQQPAAVPDIPRDPAAYKKWRETGEIKEPKPKGAESAPAKESAKGEEPEDKVAPAPEAGTETQEKPKPQRSDAATRLNELLADIKRAGLSPAELKTFRREAQQQQAKPPETTAQPPAQQPELKKPKLDDFKTWEEFETARDEYHQQRTDRAIAKAIENDRMQQAERAAREASAVKLNEAKQRYGPEAEDTILGANERIFADQAIHPAVKGLINDSPVIADLLYTMGSTPEELDEFVALAKSNPSQAIRKVVLLESLVTDELRKAAPAPANGNGGNPPPRDESGHFVKTTPAKPAKEAPPPATEVSGKSSPPKDAALAAFERGDTRAYMREMNRRDVAAKKGL